jgi:hypothetical protein
MPPVMTKQNTIVNLNFPRICGTSSKNVVFSASLLVAPYDMSMLSAWHALVWLTWTERPPMKMARREQLCEVFEEGTDKTAAFSVVAQDSEETDPKPWKTMTMER